MLQAMWGQVQKEANRVLANEAKERLPQASAGSDSALRVEDAGGREACRRATLDTSAILACILPVMSSFVAFQTGGSKNI